MASSRSTWLWIPAGMFLLLVGELVVISMRWRFPIDSWEVAGAALTGVATALWLVTMGVAGLIDPSTELTQDTFEEEHVEIDGKAATIRRNTGTATEPIGRFRALGYLIGGVGLYGFVAVMGVYSAKRVAAGASTPAPTAIPASAGPTTPPAPAPRPTPPSTTPDAAAAPPLEQPATWAEAVALARPEMGDTTNKVSPGARRLARFAATHRVTWSDVDVKQGTTIGRVFKDADAERGKALCVAGSIHSITKQDLDGHKVFTGLFTTRAREIVSFIALASTGDLVAKSRARLCGIATGTYDLRDASGAVDHTVFIVGVFDLPENR